MKHKIDAAENLAAHLKALARLAGMAPLDPEPAVETSGTKSVLLRLGAWGVVEFQEGDEGAIFAVLFDGPLGIQRLRGLRVDDPYLAALAAGEILAVLNADRLPDAARTYTLFRHSGGDLSGLPVAGALLTPTERPALLPDWLANVPDAPEDPADANEALLVAAARLADFGLAEPPAGVPPYIWDPFRDAVRRSSLARYTPAGVAEVLAETLAAGADAPAAAFLAPTRTKTIAEEVAEDGG